MPEREPDAQGSGPRLSGGGEAADGTGLSWPDRYSRQTRFAPIGPSGQEKLGRACVLIVGCGALGASLAQHMVRAGVGTVRIADRDFVEPSNLQRQMLFEEEDALASLPKAVAAANKLRRINGSVVIEPHVVDVTSAVAAELARGADLVLDGTDNAATRLALSDVVFRYGIPLLYGGVAGSRGMSAALVPGETACLRCLIGGDEEGEPAETCDTVGVISPIVEFVASLQAAEALKWLSGNRPAMRRTWLTADLWPFRVNESALPGPVPGCACCGDVRTARERDEASRRREAADLAEEIAPAAGQPFSLAASGGSGAAAGVESKTHAGDGDAPSTTPQARNRTAVDRPSSSSEATRAGSGARGAAAQLRTAVLCGRDSVQVTLGHPLNLTRIRERAASLGWAVTANPYLVRAAVPEGERLALFPDGRVLVQGTQDAELALALCERYIPQMIETEERSGGG